MKRGLGKYTAERMKNICTLLKASRKSESQELLHRLRVEIKKLKAVLSLLHFHRKKFDEDKAFLPFRDVFRACAEMREPYVRQKLAARLSGTENPALTVKPELLLQFRENIGTFLKGIRKEKKKILSASDKVSRKTIRKFLSEKKKELRKELFPAFNQKELHNNRKLIKEILYLSSQIKSKKKTNPFFEESADLIGNWHDKVVFIERLKELQSGSHDLIRKLQKDSREDLKKLKEGVNKHYA